MNHPITDVRCGDDEQRSSHHTHLQQPTSKSSQGRQNASSDVLDCLVHFLAIRPDLLILEAGLDHVQREDGGRADDARDARARQLQREHLPPSTQHVSAPVPRDRARRRRTFGTILRSLAGVTFGRRLGGEPCAAATKSG